jgi:hypothetical protein
MRLTAIRLIILLNIVAVVAAVIFVLTPSPTTYCLEGTIKIPREWHVEHFALSSIPADDRMTTPQEIRETRALCRKVEDSHMSRSAADDSVYSWSLGAVPPGEYQLDMHELHATWSVSSAVEGAGKLELVIPTPARLVIRLQSWEADGDDITTVAPTWEFGTSMPGPSMEGGPAKWNANLHAFECTVPIGLVSLEVPDGFEVVRNKTVQVPQGGCEVRAVIKQAGK